MSSLSFSPISKNLTKNIGKVEKKTQGIYFTPPNIVTSMIERCLDLNHPIKRVLEPSCGSCEVINGLEKIYKNIVIDGIEYNNTIFSEIKGLKYNNTVTLQHLDYLQYSPVEKYDLIIGNPPYFVLPKKKVDKKYYPYFNGRPNIFLLFIIKALDELKERGILAFVLPKSFMNCYYYNKLRTHIVNKYTIVDITDHSAAKYIDTGQDTIVFILRNIRDLTGTNAKFVLRVDENIIFNTPENIVKLREYRVGATSLGALKFEVSVGNVVWNQVKPLLSNDVDKTRLIYSSDIVNNALSIKKYKNLEKKNYIEKKGSTELLLVVNRGYGKGTYKFSYCLIDTDKPYLVENHLICLRSVDKMSRPLLLEKYKKIILSLQSEKTREFITNYFGNNAINTKELRDIIPIYIE